MREIEVKIIEQVVKKLCIDANYYLCDDVKEYINCKKNEEDSSVSRDILDNILENIKIAEEGVFPLCQDTGMAFVSVDIGQDVHFIGGSLEAAINEGVRQGYREGYLRKSIVADPLNRVNTKDNTPADINYGIVKGDKVKITVAPKGFGSENMSKIKMLPPSAGAKGVEDFIVSTCEEAGANPCPPIVVGVGIGGNFNKAALLAKKALLIPMNQKNSSSYYADMEERLLHRINSLGIGPQGVGGRTTALKVNIKVAPTHIAGLPVAVNINCHVNRHKEIVL